MKKNLNLGFVTDQGTLVIVFKKKNFEEKRSHNLVVSIMLR